jgi:hypothetical protein
MAKSDPESGPKPAGKAPKKIETNENSLRFLKLELTDSQHTKIKTGAAANGLGMTTFVLRAALSSAEEAINAYYKREIKPSLGKKV